MPPKRSAASSRSFRPTSSAKSALQLSSILKAVISQRLIPRSSGQGRVAAVEVMISTPFIRECMADKDKTHQIPTAIAAGTSQYRMQTFDQSIFWLYEQGLVSYEDALRWASNVDEFKLKVQGIATLPPPWPQRDGSDDGCRWERRRSTLQQIELIESAAALRQVCCVQRLETPVAQGFTPARARHGSPSGLRDRAPRVRLFARGTPGRYPRNSASPHR